MGIEYSESKSYRLSSEYIWVVLSNAVADAFDLLILQSVSIRATLFTCLAPAFQCHSDHCRPLRISWWKHAVSEKRTTYQKQRRRITLQIFSPIMSSPQVIHSVECQQKKDTPNLYPLRIIGSQSCCFGDPRPLLYTSKKSHSKSRVLWFLNPTGQDSPCRRSTGTCSFVVGNSPGFLSWRFLPVFGRLVNLFSFAGSTLGKWGGSNNLRQSFFLYLVWVCKSYLVQLKWLGWPIDSADFWISLSNSSGSWLLTMTATQITGNPNRIAWLTMVGWCFW